MVIISPRAGIMAIISPRADYETVGADYRNHSTKSARPLSIVKFEFQGDNGIFRLNQGLVRRLDYFLDRKPF